MNVNILTRDAEFFNSIFTCSKECPSLLTHVRCFCRLPAEKMSGPLIVDCSADGMSPDEIPDKFDALLSESGNSITDKGIPVIKKYQPVARLFKQISDVCLCSSGFGSPGADKCSVVCFSSPTGGAGCSTVALAAARSANRKNTESGNEKQIFYLNLEKIPTYEPQALTSGADIGEILFTLGDESLATPERVLQMISYTSEGIGFLRTGSVQSDRFGLTPERVFRLLKILTECGAFSLISIDCPFADAEMRQKISSYTTGQVVVADGADDKKADRYLNMNSREECLAIFNKTADESVGMTIPEYTVTDYESLVDEITDRLYEKSLLWGCPE